ncbi:MAG: hypothetical protein ABFR89_02465 [Actinomycetota bacterium]
MSQGGRVNWKQKYEALEKDIEALRDSHENWRAIATANRDRAIEAEDRLSMIRAGEILQEQKQMMAAEAGGLGAETEGDGA